MLDKDQNNHLRKNMRTPRMLLQGFNLSATAGELVSPEGRLDGEKCTQILDKTFLSLHKNPESGNGSLLFNKIVTTTQLYQ